MPLLAAIQQMVATHAHRVFVVDERQRPVGIMTQTDVLRKLVGWSPGLSDMGDLDVDQVDQEVDQAMEEDSEVPDCGLEPGEELVEGLVGLRGVASAAALAGWA
jgi:CBS domain containing-hemolysin-like protein